MREHDPDRTFGKKEVTPEKRSVSTQAEMNDAVETLIEDRYGGYRNLFTINPAPIPTSVAEWRERLFSYMEGTYTLANVDRAHVEVAIKWVKAKYRTDTLTSLAQVHVFWSPEPPGAAPIRTGADLKLRLRPAGVYLDADDDQALASIAVTRGQFATAKVVVPANSIELLDEDNVVVLIDDHQQKHQAAPVPGWKMYTGSPGTKFAMGKDLDWHRQTTARTVKTLVEDAVNTGRATRHQAYPIAKHEVNGIIYDLIVTFDDDTGKWVGSYHCNPEKSEYGVDIREPT